MPNEQVKTKATPLDKINTILEKMDISTQLDTWRLAGDALHKRIEDHKKDKAKEIEDLNSLQHQILI